MVVPDGEQRAAAARDLAVSSAGAALAKLLGVSPATVSTKRQRLRIAAFKPAAPRIDWSEERLTALGTATDEELAERWGVSPASVYDKRRELGIAAYAPSLLCPVVSSELRGLLGRLPVRTVSRLTGVSEVAPTPATSPPRRRAARACLLGAPRPWR